jgi:hypothetical protein
MRERRSGTPPGGRGGGGPGLGGRGVEGPPRSSFSPCTHAHLSLRRAVVSVAYSHSQRTGRGGPHLYVGMCVCVCVRLCVIGHSTNAKTHEGHAACCATATMPDKAAEDDAALLLPAPLTRPLQAPAAGAHDDDDDDEEGGGGALVGVPLNAEGHAPAAPSPMGGAEGLLAGDAVSEDGRGRLHPRLLLREVLPLVRLAAPVVVAFLLQTSLNMVLAPGPLS